MELENLTDDDLAERRAELKKVVLPDLNKKKQEATAALDDINQEFFRRFSERNSNGTRAAGYVISMTLDDKYPELVDRESFFDYLIKTAKTHLMQKRLSIGAIREELDLLTDEKERWLEKLEETEWSADVCKECLEHIAERQISEMTSSQEEADKIRRETAQKLAVLETVGTWKDSTKMALDDFYQIPGVILRDEMKLSQKRTA
jgi:hypothetical protein